MIEPAQLLCNRLQYLGWAQELFLGTSQLHGHQLPTEVGVGKGVEQ